MTETVTHPPLDISATLNGNVRAELARKSVSLRRVAAHLDLSVAAVHRRLSGDVVWDVEEVAKVAALLELAPVALLTDTP